MHQHYPALFASYNVERQQRVAHLLHSAPSSAASSLLRAGGTKVWHWAQSAAGVTGGTPSENGASARLLVDGLSLHVRNQLTATWSKKQRTFAQRLFSPSAAELVVDYLSTALHDSDVFYANVGCAVFEACQALQDELEAGPFRHPEQRIFTLDPALKNQGITRMVLDNPQALDRLLPNYRHRARLAAEDVRQVDAVFLRDRVMMRAEHQSFDLAEMRGSAAATPKPVATADENVSPPTASANRELTLWRPRPAIASRRSATKP